jgi:hypothetical protein
MHTPLGIRGQTTRLDCDPLLASLVKPSTGKSDDDQQ